MTARDSTPSPSARGIERGLIAPDQEVSEEQLFGLIFEPGFSTAKTLSSVSGRGVGMDAVRRVIDDLRGVVEVKSQKGRGTQVTLRLPLTLAIIDGLLVKVGNGPFVLQLSNVEECVELPKDEDTRQSGRSILRIRDHWCRSSASTPSSGSSGLRMPTAGWSSPASMAAAQASSSTR